jgi:hypothetical protein
MFDMTVIVMICISLIFLFKMVVILIVRIK